MPDSYIVEVKPSVYAETSLTEFDFDAISNMSTSADEVDENIRMAFTSPEDAEAWVDNQSQDLDYERDGRLRLHRAHTNDTSTVDAYLLFKPKTKN